MIVYVLVGGMKGTTWVQIIKAVAAHRRRRLMTVWVLGKYGFNLSDLLGDAAAPRAARAARSLDARPAVRKTDTDASSTSCRSALALVLGTAGLPHILMRFYTVPDRQGGPAQSVCGRSG